MRPPPPPPILGESVQVLHVVRPAAGGIRQHVIELIRRADAARFSVSLAGPADFLGGLPTDLPLTAAVPLDIAARLSPWRDRRAAGQLSRLVVAHPHGLVHAHGLRAAFVAALAHRRRRFPFVFTAHNLVPGHPLTRLGVRFAGSHASQIIAISQAVADGLIAGGVPAGKISVIPNGVERTYFQEAPLTRSLGEPGSFTVGCVARLSPEKGVDVLVRAARLQPEMRFLIAGDGPEREALHRAAPPQVRWLGRVPDTRAVYAAADAMALPSRQEGQGIVALEAMAAGVPLVASRVGGLAEMLRDGETALLVPPDDPPALAAALTRLRDDPALRTRLAANGQALVREKYDIGRMVEAVAQVYQAVAAG